MKLMHGDCLELMKEIPDGSIDLILTDPPYGVTSCRWDKIIDIREMWNEYRRILKPQGVIAIFGQEPFSTRLRIECMEWFKYDWIWKKNKKTGYHQAKNMPLKNCELISVFSPAKIGHKLTAAGAVVRMPYNPQGLVYEPKEVRGRNENGHVYTTRPSNKERYVKEFTGYPSQLLEFDAVIQKDKLNPSQKPVALLEYLIRTYTSPGEVVLDNCMGSGSTGVACVNTGRDFIGIEKDDDYFRIAAERIRKAEEEQMLAYTD